MLLRRDLFFFHSIYFYFSHDLHVQVVVRKMTSCILPNEAIIMSRRIF